MYVIRKRLKWMVKSGRVSISKVVSRSTYVKEYGRSENDNNF